MAMTSSERINLINDVLQRVRRLIAIGGGGTGPAGPPGPPAPTATTAVKGISRVDHNSAGDPVALTVAGHGTAANQHPEYTTDAEADLLADISSAAAVAAHEALPNPHPDYTTVPEVDILAAAQAAAAVGDHEADPDPHTQYTLSTELAAHVADADPHIVYQRESEKGGVSGYAGLGANSLVPVAQLGTGGTGGSTRFLREDQTYAVPAGGGGGGGATVGTAVLNFGAVPTDEASIAVVGQAGIVAGSIAQAYVMRESTGDNNVEEHEGLGVWVRLIVGEIIAGTGFTIRAHLMAGFATGTFNIRWAWQ